MLRQKYLNLFVSKSWFSTLRNANLHYNLTKSTNNSPINLLLLPGLLGSIKNFSNVCSNNEILSRVNCYALDLRNQGDTEHLPSMSMSEAADDVFNFIRDQKLKNIILLGHCYGGRVVMRMVTKKTDNILGVIISDISPYNYWADKDYGFVRSLRIMIERFMAVDLNQTQTGILSSFAKISGSKEIALSMLGALEKVDPHSYKWKPNMKVISECFGKDVMGNIFDQNELVNKYTGPRLVIRCERSEYVLPKVIHSFNDVFQNFNENTDISFMKNCGHFPYFEKPDEYIKILEAFFDRFRV